VCVWVACEVVKSWVHCSVGYGIKSDLKMLSKSWPFVSDILAEPERVIDLKVLDTQVSLEGLVRWGLGI
jgi:hypothetical protein